ncbi:MAG: hypothetical protein J3R72DRAFT_445033 [Linnemannia gamsii]|nr:MAG: hypothetical protein J3R72DRAFT_445033 [Linnemannia gamsii]
MNRWNQLFCLTEDFVGLRTLILKFSVDFEMLFKALDRLPGVTHLRVDGFLGNGRMSNGVAAAFVESRKQAENGQSLSVRMLEILCIPWGREGGLALLLLELFPSLVEFSTNSVLRGEVMDALWEHCYFLDAINGKKGAAGWRERRMERGLFG